MNGKIQSKDIGRFVNGFLKVPGQHLLEIGQTGTGKTNGLYYVVDGLVNYAPQSTIVWIDTGKTSEFLTLAKFRPLHLLIPAGCDIDIVPAEDSPNLDITKSYLVNYEDVWQSLDPNRINIVSFSRFVRDHISHARIISKIFEKLINAAYEYQVPVPMEIFCDEAQFLIPAKHVAMTPQHYKSGLNIVFSLFTLRSLKIRINAAAQSWGTITPAARESFPWLMIRRGAFFFDGKLRRFNELWEKVPKGYCWLVFPTRDFSDAIISLPFYGDGETMGRIYYRGQLSINRDEEKKDGVKAKKSE